MIRDILGRIGAYAVVALVMLALAIGGLAERMCRPKSHE
jgi:hypothetical protein